MSNACDSNAKAKEFAKAVGRAVVSIDQKGSDLTLHLDNGDRLCFALKGDCCSDSYFTDEAKEDAKDLVGSRIHSIEEVKEHDESTREYPDADDAHYVDQILWYFLKFTTDRGHVTLDWRNDSNGYYSGSLSVEYIQVVS